MGVAERAMRRIELAFRRGREAMVRLRGAVRPANPLDLKRVNVRFVDILKARMPHDEAMKHAIGGGFDEVGAIELALLRRYGLPQDGHLVDVGCGSGRLAGPLAGWLKGTYLGIDLVPDLVAHARKVAGRPDWRFEVIDHIGIPEADGRADMVCFFSVLTHLLHEQSYWYLEEARRVLKPGGRIVFSFLEFREPGHLPIFWATLEASKARVQAPMNVFIDRDAIAVWARELGMEIEDLRFGAEQIVAEGVLGQSICVLRKPA
jgi:SAM-dependent methyltransferase